jgi:hypothetical protein
MENREKFTFYNSFNNGDIFFSRIVMKPFMNQKNIEFYHKEKKGLFRDLENVIENDFLPEDFSISKNEVFDEGGLISKPINCWVAQDIGSRQSPYQNYPFPGCNFENYVGIAYELCKLYNIKPFENIEDFLPEINFNNLPTKKDIDNLMYEYSLVYDKIILFCNGHVRSGQSENFDFTPVITKLANENPKMLFLTTHQIDVGCENVVPTSLITNITPDLLEISYIATLSDVIVGRGSGPYTLSQNKENLLNPNKKFVCFGNNRFIAKFYQNCKCQVWWTQFYDFDNQYKLLSSVINTN